LEFDIGDMSIGKIQADALGGTEVSQIRGGLYGDATVRLGYAMNNALLYAKGGYAFYDGMADQTTGLAGFTIQNAGVFNGWTIGGGLEYKISPNMSVKAEYMYYDFGDPKATLTSAAGPFHYKNDLTENTAKIGVNYLFGSR
jgi:outer membrane immunogenic protein